MDTAMVDGSDMQPGEIARSLSRIEANLEAVRLEVRDRHHELANKVNEQLGPISINTAKMAMLESTILSLTTKVDTVTASANKIAGIGALLAVAGAWILSWFRHP